MVPFSTEINSKIKSSSSKFFPFKSRARLKSYKLEVTEVISPFFFIKVMVKTGTYIHIFFSLDKWDWPDSS